MLPTEGKSLLPSPDSLSSVSTQFRSHLVLISYFRHFEYNSDFNSTLVLCVPCFWVFWTLVWLLKFLDPYLQNSDDHSFWWFPSQIQTYIRATSQARILNSFIYMACNLFSWVLISRTIDHLVSARMHSATLRKLLWVRWTRNVHVSSSTLMHLGTYLSQRERTVCVSSL